jgi:hypothetical protein
MARVNSRETSGFRLSPGEKQLPVISRSGHGVFCPGKPRWRPATKGSSIQWSEWLERMVPGYASGECGRVRLATSTAADELALSVHDELRSWVVETTEPPSITISRLRSRYEITGSPSYFVTAPFAVSRIFPVNGVLTQRLMYNTSPSTSSRLAILHETSSILDQPIG